MSNKSSSLKLGVIGCGQVAEHKHLIVLQHLPNVEVVAAADLDPGRLQLVADRFHIARRYTDYDALLDNPEVEAVAVCVPAQFHAEVALAVMKAKRHLFIEKPLALSLDDCDRLIEGARHTPVKIMVGFHMRWHRLVRQARALIQQGALGDLESLHAVWNSPIRYDGSLPAWRYQRSQGGGALVEIAVHHFDLWRFLLQSEVTEIFAMTRFEQQVDETATVSARMANSVLATGFFSERTGHDSEVYLYGRAGRLRVSCLRFDGLEFFPAASVPGGLQTRLRQLAHLLKELPHGIFNRLPGGEYIASYQAQWRHFIESIRNDTPVECTLEDGRRALQVVLAAVESASRGRPVEVSQASRHIIPIG